MSMWWIGVKGSKLVTFEATKVEALSADFTREFGVAFGSYRSQGQAEAGIKEHGASLIESAAEEVEISKEQPETPLKTSKPAQLEGDAVWTSPVTPFSVAFSELQTLKVQIVRTLEALVELKGYIEEKSEDKDKKV